MNGDPWRPSESLSLVVPIYHEEERVTEKGPELAAFVAGLPYGSELIFVDDGSTDGTVVAVEKILASWPDLCARVLKLPHAGKGAAVMAGLEAATAEYAGFCDVDLSTSLDQLRLIFRAATMSPVLAIGSRDVVGSRLVKRQSLLRELLGRAYNRAVQLLLVPGISDTQCGAKVARTEVWKEILPHCAEVGFAWDVEATSVSRRLGLVVQEVAVEWRNDERSRVKVTRDGVGMVLALARIWGRVRRIRPLAGAPPPSPDVFDDDQASTLLESDTSHWWFRSKAAFVAAALRRHVKPDPGALASARLVDVGAGAGGVTTILGLPPQGLVSLDGSETLCREARDRHALLTAVSLGEAIPLRGQAADVVTLLDVIEHLGRPVEVLVEARRVLHDDGLLVVNVPAHPWLWSAADVYLGHHRRYTRPLLRRHLEAGGFRVVWMSHVFSWLVLPVWVSRLLRSDPRRQLGLEERGTVIDAAALVLTSLERALVRRVQLPIGTSILCVAVKEVPAPAGHRAPPAG